MLVFGTKTLYASHLPMFRPKHRYQAVSDAEMHLERDDHPDDGLRAGGP